MYTKGMLFTMMKENLSKEIKEKSCEFGYDLCGIIEAKSFNEFNDYIKARVETFPSSTHLYKNLYSLGEPSQKVDWAKSIIVCIRRYNQYKIPKKLNKLLGKLYLFDGRLSYSKEHSAKAKLEEYFKEQAMKFYCGGVSARWAAVKAGLGNFRKNNFVYTKFGSYVWIDTWIVDAELEYDKETNSDFRACPSSCNKCINACPTKALSGDFSMDRGACIAQLSFYSTDLPSEEMREKMETWMYGCDVCQDVCPMNKNKCTEEEDFPELDKLSELLSLEQILTMDEDTFLNILQPRFWYISKDDFWLWKCNALRAMANSGDIKYAEYIKNACNDKDDKVKTMATWALKKFDV